MHPTRMSRAEREAHMDRRAVELADSGRCHNWRTVAALLQGEGFPEAMVYLCRKPTKDKLDGRCAAAQMIESK